MTCEEYYGKENYRRLQKAALALKKTAEELQSAYRDSEDVQPIVYCCQRIKSPESMREKLIRKGFPDTAEFALANVYDAVGFRIVCAFESDVHAVVSRLSENNTFEIVKKKDYLSYPKPNGYRSIHLCVRMKDSGVLAEIQVRTIAMDCWATLEHQLQYKRDIADGKLIRSELKRCADEIASVDLSMQTIREILKT